MNPLKIISMHIMVLISVIIYFDLFFILTSSSSSSLCNKIFFIFYYKVVDTITTIVINVMRNNFKNIGRKHPFCKLSKVTK
jgi:hypothetical protein